MKRKTPTLDGDQLRMRAYLLGGLSEQERTELETRFFEDEDYYDRLLEMQYDLIDAYTRGALTPEERDQVEERLLARPDGPRRALLARALQRMETQSVQPPGPTARGKFGVLSDTRLLAAAVLTIASVSGAVWLGLENARLRQELSRVERPAVAPVEPATSTPAATRPEEATQIIADLTLQPQVLRGDQAIRVVRIPSQARLVRVLLSTNEPASSFAVALEKAGTGRVWTQNRVTQRQEEALIVWLPADALQPGDYELLVWRERESPSTLVGTYNVRIVRE